MSDDDCENKGRLTVDCREYFNEKFKELDKRLDLRYELTDKAVKKTEADLEMRLEGMNEFRQQLSNQAATFVNKNEFDLQMRVIEDKIDLLAKMVYIGAGILAAIEILLRFIK